MELLFVYGTLKDRETQQAVVGRRLSGRPGRLRGFRMKSLREGQTVYPIIEESAGDVDSDVIDGLVLEVSSEDLKRLDVYEGQSYRRGRVALESGEECWVYMR